MRGVRCNHILGLYQAGGIKVASVTHAGMEIEWVMYDWGKGAYAPAIFV